jgi:hypothetical protein
VKWPGAVNDVALFTKDEVHETRSAAVAHASHLRDEKIASLRKQLAKLETLAFE